MKSLKQIKKVLCFLLALAMIISNINVHAKEGNEIKIPYKEIGRYIAASSKSPSAVYNAQNAGNNSGMSGSDSVIHTHTSGDAQNTMWLSKENDFDKSYISYDLGSIVQLGKAFVWNYNAPNNTENGLRKVDIYYSMDDKNWKLLGGYELDKSSGEENIKATNLTDGGLIDFKGVSTRYVKIVPQKKDGNWGGKAYGLSEIRFYEYKLEARKDGYLAATIYNPVSSKITEEQYRLVNGLGLSDPSSQKAFHNNNPEHMYLTDKPNYIVFDLKGSYPISTMNIYNYNVTSNTKNGLKDVTISTAVEYGKWEKLQDVSLKEANGSNKLSATDKIPFNNKLARFIKLEMKSNYGGDKYGLSAVRFYAGEGYYAEAADEWTGLLSSYKGWSGADGIFTTALDGVETSGFSKRPENNKTFFVFSDTFVSTVSPVTKKRQDTKMINQSYAVLEGNDPFNSKITFTTSASTLPMKPSGPRTGYYWQGDTFVNNNKVHTFPLYIENVKEGLGFAQKGEDLASFDLKDGNVDFASLKIKDDLETKYLSNFEQKPIIFGSAVLVNTKEAGVSSPDGYVYIYGYMDSPGMKRELVAARVKSDKVEDFKSYEYYSGEGWTKDIKKVKGLAANVAPEVSVTQISTGENTGKYLLVYTYMTNTNNIVCRIGDSPVGPFHDEQELYYITETSKLGNDAFAYNAKAHPVLSEEGELLISYNVNYSNTLTGHYNNADCYRPRFIRLAKVGQAVEDTYDPSKDKGDVNSTPKKEKNSLPLKGNTGYIVAIALLVVVNLGVLTYIIRRNKKIK